MNVFVIMQFDDDLDTVYQDLIKVPLEQRNHIVNRADDISRDQNILRTIVSSIRDADLVIADLTGQNPNVYYELGIAHDMRKPTLHIVQDYADLAFDVRPYNAIRYSTRYNEANKLSQAILDITERDTSNMYRFSNPVNESLDHEAPIYIGDADAEYSDGMDSSVLEEISVAEISVNTVFDMISQLSERYLAASEKATKHRESTAGLSEDDQYSRKLLLTRVFSKYVNDFSNDVIVDMPVFKDAWTTLDQDLNLLYVSDRIQTPAARNEVETFVETVVLLNKKLAEIASKLDSFVDSFVVDYGLSRDVDRELDLSRTSLSKLKDELRAGSALLTRIIGRTTLALQEAAH